MPYEGVAVIAAKMKPVPAKPFSGPSLWCQESAYLNRRALAVESSARCRGRVAPKVTLGIRSQPRGRQHAHGWHPRQLEEAILVLPTASHYVLVGNGWPRTARHVAAPLHRPGILARAPYERPMAFLVTSGDPPADHGILAAAKHHHPLRPLLLCIAHALVWDDGG